MEYIKNSINYWDKIHESYKLDEIKTDNWLEKFNDIIDKTSLPIIDLGCESGNDTLYLLNKNKKVISWDLSKNAIDNIKKNFPQVVDALCFNMLNGLPFKENSSDIIIADLSLHYFLKNKIIHLIKELKRVLNPNGYLIFRVNSINDFKHRSSEDKEVELHTYKTIDGRLKRFFDEEDIKNFFSEFKIEYLKEETMDRYKLEKKLYRGCLKNIK